MEWKYLKLSLILCIFSINSEPINYKTSSLKNVYILSLSWSKNNIITAGLTNGQLISWDFQPKKFNLNFLPKFTRSLGKTVHALRWSPDGNLLAAGGENQPNKHGDLKIWSYCKTNKLLSKKPVYKNLKNKTIDDISWSKDGNYLASTSLGMKDNIQIWQYAKKNINFLKSLRLKKHATSTDWSTKKNQFIAGGAGKNKEIILGTIDSNNKKTPIRIKKLKSYTKDITSISWSKDNYLAIHENGRLLSLSNKKFLKKYKNKKWNPCIVSWSPNGLFLAIHSLLNSTLSIWQINKKTSKLTKIKQKITKNLIENFTWSPDSNYLAIATKEKDLCIYKFNQKTLQFSLISKKNLKHIIDKL